MKKQPKVIPQFTTEDEERDFWATHDPTDYFDTTKSVDMDFSNLKTSTKTISLRIPQGLLVDIKRLANKKDVPYQSLMKIYLSERVEQEFKGK